MANSVTMFPAELVPGLISQVKGKSSIAQLAGQTPISFTGNTYMTFNMDSEVDLVAENGAKSEGGITVGSVTITPVKIEYGARVSDEFMYAAEDKKLDILTAFAEGFARKAGRGLDIMAFHGLNPRTSTAATVLATNNFDAVITNSVTYDAATNPDAKVGRSTVTVTKTTDSEAETIFSGRCLSTTLHMDSDGKVYKSCVFEGDLAYLRDTIQEAYTVELADTTADTVTNVLNNENGVILPQMVGAHNENSDFQIAIGSIEAKGFEIGSGFSDYTTTFDVLKTLYVDNLGGEIRLRQEDGTNYIDFSSEFGETSDTVIELGTNMKEMTAYEDISTLVTRLYPYGNPMYDNEDYDRLTIQPYNGGVPYIDNEDLINTYGIRCGVQIFDVSCTELSKIVSCAARLYRKGVDYLNKQSPGVKQYTISALDLSGIDANFEELKLYNKYRVVNSLLGIDEYLRVIGKTYDFDNPYLSQITIGDKVNTLTKRLAK